MPSYVFHARDGVDSLDGAHFDCADFESLRKEALRIAGELLRDALAQNFGVTLI